MGGEGRSFLITLKLLKYCCDNRKKRVESSPLYPSYFQVNRRHQLLSPNLSPCLIHLLQPQNRSQKTKSSIFVAWEQVLDASEWSEHSTRRDESHIYGVYSILGFVYLSSIQRITESLSPDATSLLRTLRSYGQMRTYLRMLSGALLFLPSVLHRGKQHRFCYELLCKNRSLTV